MRMYKSVMGVAVGMMAAVMLMAGGGASALNLFGNTITVQPSPQVAQASDQARHDCVQFKNHEYEVCTAYVLNASLETLWPYYAYNTSGNSTLAGFVTYRLGLRYTGQAHDVLTQRVASWPQGSHDVAVPDIDIVSVDSNLSADTATLQTKESWLVTDGGGHVIYQENATPHAITMHRVPSYVLHKWVVSDIH